MTVQYVLNLQRALELGIISVLVPPAAASSEDSSDSDGIFDELGALYQGLLTYLPQGETDVGQRHILRYIQERPEGTTVQEIATHFKISTSVAVGIINGGLQRNIKKAGFATIDDILWLEKKARKWHYSPGAVLQRQPPVPL